MWWQKCQDSVRPNEIPNSR